MMAQHLPYKKTQNTSGESDLDDFGLTTWDENQDEELEDRNTEEDIVITAMASGNVTEREDIRIQKASENSHNTREYNSQSIQNMKSTEENTHDVSGKYEGGN